jgi:hypothetical protein
MFLSAHRRKSLSISGSFIDSISCNDCSMFCRLGIVLGLKTGDAFIIIGQIITKINFDAFLENDIIFVTPYKLRFSAVMGKIIFMQ